MAYPEGCPPHPSYPVGHAVIAGACVTVLKAFFNESFLLPQPVVASADGLSLLPYKETNLTVGGELNKLAANISLARNTAGGPLALGWHRGIEARRGGGGGRPARPAGDVS